MARGPRVHRAMRVRRRQAVRFGPRSPPTLVGHTLDVSQRGLSIGAREAFAPGTPLVLEVDTGDGWLPLRGRVVWAEQRVGLRSPAFAMGLRLEAAFVGWAADLRARPFADDEPVPPLSPDALLEATPTDVPRAARYPLALPVRFGEGLAVVGVTVNVSSTGLQVRTRTPLKPGTRVPVRVELQEGRSVAHCVARVQWARVDADPFRPLSTGLRLVERDPVFDAFLAQLAGTHVPGARQGDGALTPVRVLMLDDRREVLSVARRWFAQKGSEFVLETASELGRLEELVAAFAPDALVCDLEMRALEGDGLRRLLDRGRVPCVVFSGADEQACAVRAAAVRADAFVPKQEGMRALAATLRRLVRGA